VAWGEGEKQGGGGQQGRGGGGIQPHDLLDDRQGDRGSALCEGGNWPWAVAV
jgi:hypothetical protein